MSGVHAISNAIGVGWRCCRRDPELLESLPRGRGPHGSGEIARAQPGDLYLSARHRERVESLDHLPVLLSVIHEGEVVRQQEVVLWANNGSQVLFRGLAPGVYDARAEGDGLVTESKRGIHVLPDGKNVIQFVMRPGSGAHVVEYATGGLTREETAARLATLEAEVARLRGD